MNKKKGSFGLFKEYFIACKIKHKANAHKKPKNIGCEQKCIVIDHIYQVDELSFIRAAVAFDAEASANTSGKLLMTSSCSSALLIKCSFL